MPSSCQSDGVSDSVVVCQVVCLSPSRDKSGNVYPETPHDQLVVVLRRYSGYGCGVLLVNIIACVYVYRWPELQVVEGDNRIHISFPIEFNWV